MATCSSIAWAASADSSRGKGRGTADRLRDLDTTDLLRCEHSIHERRTGCTPPQPSHAYRRRRRPGERFDIPTHAGSCPSDSPSIAFRQDVSAQQPNEGSDSEREGWHSLVVASAAQSLCNVSSQPVLGNSEAPFAPHRARAERVRRPSRWPDAIAPCSVHHPGADRGAAEAASCCLRRCLGTSGRVRVGTSLAPGCCCSLLPVRHARLGPRVAITQYSAFALAVRGETAGVRECDIVWYGRETSLGREKGDESFGCGCALATSGRGQRHCHCGGLCLRCKASQLQFQLSPDVCLDERTSERLLTAKSGPGGV